MNRENIVKVVEQIQEIRRYWAKGPNVMVTCPFARWTHGKGRDGKPSCGIKVVDNDESPYNCFSCGMKGTLHDLVSELNFRTEGEYEELENEVLELEIIDFDNVIDVAFTSVKKRNSKHEIDAMMEVRSEDELIPFAGGVPRYAIDRGLTLDTCRAWGLGHDRKKKRLLFTIRRAPDKALVGMVGRSYVDEEPKYLDYVGFSKSRYLYGEWMVPDDAKRLVVVEGPIDVLAGYQAGEASLGIMGAFASTEQTRKIAYYELPVFLFPDGDLAGKKWANRLGEDLRKEGVQVRDVWAGEDVDPSDLTVKAYRKTLQRARVRI